MHIRPETPADIDAIRALTAAAFAGMPHASGTEAAIIDALRAAGALVRSLVAEEDGAPVGHVAFSPVTIEGADRRWLGLGPVSVLPGRQGAGIGSALVRTGLAQVADAAGCVLLGAPGYYRRFGFIADPALRYPSAPAEYFLSRVLAGPPASGTVAFHPAFGAA